MFHCTEHPHLKTIFRIENTGRKMFRAFFPIVRKKFNFPSTLCHGPRPKEYIQVEICTGSKMRMKKKMRKLEEREYRM